MAKLHYVCKYTPVELLTALGAECVLLDETPENFALSDQIAHPNLCGFGKSVIQAVRAGHVRELVMVNCCDTIRSIYDILKEYGELDFIYLLDLPHCRDACAVDSFGTQLCALAEAYAAHTGQHFDPEVFFSVFRPAERITEPHVAVIGAKMGSELFRMTQDLMPIPAVNATCTGNRDVHAPERTADFAALMEAYGRSLLGQLPCMRMADAAGRRALLNTPGLSGVICHTMQFCDYYGFEYAALKEALTIPMVKIESDGTAQSREQLRTRISAFAEGFEGPEQNVEIVEGGYYAGIDSGSTSTDVIILDENRNIVARTIMPTGAGAADGADRALALALEESGLKKEALAGIVTTGYGRSAIRAGDKSITEISCHAKGAHFLNPDVRTVIDIGGQDSKVIRVDEKGGVLNFVMNDKCAAGTGRFLEMMARTLQLTLEEISEIGLTWKEDITISSMCTVFADSEVVSLVAQNKALPDIVHGLNNSVAVRAAALYRRVHGEPVCMMTGGVSRNRGVVRAIEERLGVKLAIDPDAQLCGALGAALAAAEMHGR